MRLSHAILLLLGACAGNDYGVAKGTDANPGADRPVDLALDVAHQAHDHGQSVSRCQVQVAFQPLLEDAPGGSRTAVSAEVARPEAPGTCAFSEVAAAPAPPPSEQDADDWQVSGAVIGPAIVTMGDAQGDLTLHAVETDQGGLRYELPDCAADRFPFSRTLGLDVPDSDDPDGVHAFVVPDLVAVGPQVAFEAPARTETGAQPTLDPAEDLPVRWSLLGPDPVVDGAPVAPETRVQIQHQDRTGEAPTRWLVCWPEEEGWFDVPADQLALLVDGREDPAAWRTTVDVHTEVEGAPQLTPWGRTLQVKAHVSAGGGVQLDGTVSP